jgi:fructose-1-phosphate kinase PfkB-like protein
LQGFSLEQAIIYGVAAGTANTLTIGAGQFKVDDFERLRNEVQISAQPE